MLTKIPEFPSLQTITSSLFILDNVSLPAITGFQSLSYVDWSFQIIGNTNLDSVCGLYDYFDGNVGYTGSGAFDIHTNGAALPDPTTIDDVLLAGRCSPQLSASSLVPGQDATWSLSAAPTGATAYFLGSVDGAGTTCSPGGAVCVGLDQAFVLGSAPVGPTGTAEFTMRVPPGAPSGPIDFQAVWFRQGVGESSNVVTSQLP